MSHDENPLNAFAFWTTHPIVIKPFAAPLTGNGLRKRSSGGGGNSAGRLPQVRCRGEVLSA